MAGYLGTKAVFLSTTAASVTGDATIGGDLTIGSNALFVDESTGDISFYEDTGTTAKLHWSASAESLGIGTSSPASALELEGVGNAANITLDNTTVSTGRSYSIRSGNTGKLDFYDNDATTARLVIDASGNVGIGTSSPNGIISTLETNSVTAVNVNEGAQFSRVNSSGNGQMNFVSLNVSGNGGTNNGWGGIGLVQPTASSNNADLLFFTRGSSIAERMRIDSSGNLLVGTTNPNLYQASAGSTADNGFVYGVNDFGTFSRYAADPLIVNRTGTDGGIVQFRKDGSTVGSIEIINSSLICSLTANGTGGSGIGVHKNVPNIYPVQDGNTVDNTLDLGSGSRRWDDIYATNSTIQTSDQNEKQQIASLTTAEMDAAKAISQLFKTFKWNDSVADKGDAARTHAGVIAQEVETAMTDAGLDAGDYAFFISSTWWETQTDVPAVAAVAEVLDDDGNVVTEAVEAQDAYTRTDTYDTLADAPAGATERTRKGIRYPELLSFVGAATEQRLADIETRLTALEAV